MGDRADVLAADGDRACRNGRRPDGLVFATQNADQSFIMNDPYDGIEGRRSKQVCLSENFR